MLDENTKTGKIDWVLYDPDDESTPFLHELLIIGLKGTKAKFMRGYFGFSTDFFYEVRYGKRGRITKDLHRFSDYTEIAWADLNVPSWWHRKEKEDASK